MQTYLDLVRFVLENGESKTDRTGTGTISVFGHQTRYDVRDGFPLLTTKKIYFESVVRELLWFLKGSTNIYDGLSPETKIWDPWADEQGNLGPIYGHQWRHWERYSQDEITGKITRSNIDQIQIAIDTIRNNPDSRRIIVSAWNVGDLDQMALPPCHSFFQFYVSGNHLDLQLYQRSADLALGVPFNIASYALLLQMVAQECQLTPRFFIHTFGDLHIYQNHIDGLREQLGRTPRSLPTISIAKKPIFDLTFADIQLHNYKPDPFIRFAVAV